MPDSNQRRFAISDDAAKAASEAEPLAWQGPVPLLYRNPQFLNLPRHRDAGLREGGNYGFARETNSVPLGADEVFLMQAYCPVVFTQSEPAIPVAVLGIGGHSNSFVDEQGQWRAGVPIPAYIRRYPFIAAIEPVANKIHLAIDEGAPTFTMNGGRRFFENDVPSEFSREALKFCAAYQAQFDFARAIGEAVAAAGLLVDRRFDLRRGDGSVISLDGFRIIDEGRFNALSDETFLTWRKRNFLGTIYAHMLSMRRWAVFADLAPKA